MSDNLKNKISLMAKLNKVLFGYFNEDKKWTDAELKISQREIGGKVELIDGEGKLQPAPDGDYVMEDGFKFTVKDGQISAIDGQKDEAPVEEKPVEQDVTPVDENQPDTNNEVADLKAQVAEVVNAIADLQSQIAEIKQAQEQGPIAASIAKTEVEEMSNQITELFSALKRISFDASKTNKNSIVEDDRNAKLTALQKILNKK